MQKLKPIFFYLVLFLLCLALSSYALGLDYDLWARLIVGMAVVQTGQILRQDFMSYIPTHDWIDHEWGSSVVFYVVQNAFGGAGIIVLQAILTFLIFVFIFKTVEIHLKEGVSKYNIVFYLFGLFAIKEVFLYPIRCHMFTFLFFAVLLYILELSRVKNINKPLFLIPFLIVLWNNMHGGVVAGIGLLCIYILGEILNKKPWKKYGYLLLTIIPLLLINPYGFEYLKFLFMANTMPRTDIVEWWGLFSKYHLHSYYEFKFFAVFILIVEAIKTFKNGFSYQKLDKTKFLILLFTLILAVDSVKLVRFFIIAGMVFTYNDFYSLIMNSKIFKWKNLFIYTVILIFAVGAIRHNGLKAKVNFGFPVVETEFVKVNNLKGNILVNLGLGSYVAYKLYPDNLIYMDGRYEEVYYDEMVPLLKNFHILAENWDEILKKYPPDVMILENPYPIIDRLIKTKGWKMVFAGPKFTVFVSDKIKKDKYIKPVENLEYYEKKLFDTRIDFRKKKE